MMRTIISLALFVATLASAQGLESVNSHISKQDSLFRITTIISVNWSRYIPIPIVLLAGRMGLTRL